MKEWGRWKRYENCIIASVTILVNILVLSIRFDFYYDLNDDVFMRNVMSGAYTGMPDGHNGMKTPTKRTKHGFAGITRPRSLTSPFYQKS